MTLATPSHKFLLKTLAPQELQVRWLKLLQRKRFLPGEGQISFKKRPNIDSEEAKCFFKKRPNIDLEEANKLTFQAIFQDSAFQHAC